MEALVKIRGLTFSRNTRRIFENLDIDIKKGRITAIMGPSGSGKTTVLRLIGAQLFPDSGTVMVGEDNIHTLSSNALYEARKKMGMLFQNAALFTNLNVFENVAFPLREHTHLSESLIRRLVLMKLEVVGLRGARNLYPSECSGGMARRVALARAIALDPELIMYDEPFAGQDPVSMGVLVKLIKELNTILGTTTIIVSHDVPETLSIADDIYLMMDGKLVGIGSPEVLMASEEPHIKQFMHGLPDGAVPFHFPAVAYREDLFA